MQEAYISGHGRGCVRRTENQEEHITLSTPQQLISWGGSIALLYCFSSHPGSRSIDSLEQALVVMNDLGSRMC